MKTYVLALPAAEVIHLLRAEMEAAEGAPELDIGPPEREYVVEEDFDRGTYGIHNGREFDLVTSITTLTIEPRVESGYWILETVIQRPLGLVRTSQEDELTRKDLTLDEFEAELRAPGRKRVTVRLYVQTSAVRVDFDRWLADMRARHPWAPAPGQEAPALAQPGAQDEPAAEETDERTREAVAVFRDADTLEAAVDALEVAGFDRAAISVLATDAEARERIARFYRTVRDIEDSEWVARGAFVSRNSRTEAEATAVGAPIYIGGFAGAAAVAASGGALALAIAAAIAGAMAGAGLGAILAATLAHRYWTHVQEQLAMGGLVLWVSVPDAEAERRALAVLNKLEAWDVHVHTFEHEWSPAAIPLYLAQPDPFLEKERH